mgnify:CR=1 FL=1
MVTFSVLCLTLYWILQARIQEKLKHTEEKLQFEKEDGYQKLKASESTTKELERKLESASNEVVQFSDNITKLEKSIVQLQGEHEQNLSSVVSVSSMFLSFAFSICIFLHI